jgi:Zn-dependent peptidase ImmA (M78 family)
VIALAGKLIDLYSPDRESPQLRDLVREEVIDDSRKRPWAQGYSLAEEILEDLSLPGGSDEWVDVRGIYENLEISFDVLALNDRGIRAVSLAGPEHRPSTLLNPNHVTYLSEPGQRFTLAHELCHILFDRGYGARLAIASGPWAPSDVEARANAFAAMLLMPTELIRRLVRSLSQPVNSVAGVREMAAKLHTSFKATLEHLKNLNFLSEEEHDWIEIEAEHGQPARPSEDIEREFRELAERWGRETGYFSSVSKKLNHPAYRAIIEMGERAVPWILRELRDRPALWFEALKAITGQTPVPAGAQSDPRQAREAWLKWGREKGLIEQPRRPEG